MEARKVLFAMCVAIAMMSWCFRVLAQERARCSRTITRFNVVPCVLAASPLLRASEESIAAARGHRMASNPFLPSNPTLGFSAAHRQATSRMDNDREAFNWYVTLAQEIEIANQRGARLRSAEALLHAEQQRGIVNARAAAAAAWTLYFEVLASKERLLLAQRLEQIVHSIAQVAKARAQEGLASVVESELADASWTRAVRARIDADREHEVARQTIAEVLNANSLDSALDVKGALEPLAIAEELQRNPRAFQTRPEVQVFLAQSTAQQAQRSLYRRARVPNLTVSAFAQNDGFKERVFGMGLQVPIPLPQPVGRTYAGEIAQTEALEKKARLEANHAERVARIRYASALSEYKARRAQREIFSDERLARTERILSAIAEEIRAGRLALRDALLAEQTLVTLLEDGVEARASLSVISVELALAAGVALERGVQ